MAQWHNCAYCPCRTKCITRFHEWSNRLYASTSATYKGGKSHVVLYTDEYFHHTAHSRSFPVCIFTVNNPVFYIVWFPSSFLDPSVWKLASIFNHSIIIACKCFAGRVIWSWRVFCLAWQHWPRRFPLEEHPPSSRHSLRHINFLD